MEKIVTYEPKSKHEAELYYQCSADLQIPDGLHFMSHLMISEGSKVLDLGCGTGNLTVELAKRVGPKGYVIGVDPDGERINVAKKKNCASNISYVKTDGESFPSGEYDMVFSTYVLHWIENKDAVFKRVYNNLCPGGVFAFTTTLSMPPLMAEETKIMNKTTQEKIENHWFFTSPQKLEELANSNGFQVVSKEIEISRHQFPDIESALEFIYASTNGIMDTAQANCKALNKWRLQYTTQSVEFTEEVASFILTKI